MSPVPVFPVICDGGVSVYVSDAVDVLAKLEADSVDAVVTDPPYGIDFAGNRWDGTAGFVESLPGVNMTGMSAGEVFQLWCRTWATQVLRVVKPGGYLLAFGGTRMWHRMVAGVEEAGFQIRDQIAWIYSSGMPKSMDISAAIDKHLGLDRPDRTVEVMSHSSVLGLVRHVTDKGQPVSVEAKRFAGFGTGLKPAFEPIIVARKPVEGTVVSTVLAYGTGGLNIDAARGSGGKWPPNVVLDETQAAILPRLSAGRDVSAFPVFRFCSKAPASQRPRAYGVSHATVKPLALMSWLIRLVTPPGGTVLDPFAGSGTTLQAAVNGGFGAVGIEKDPAFIELIRARLNHIGP